MQIEYLTVKQASEIAHVSCGTLKAHARSGKLRAYRLGNKLIIKPADLEAYLWADPVQPKTGHGDASGPQ